MRSCSVDSTALRCVSVYVDKVCLSRRYGLSGRGIWTWATVIGRKYCTASQRWRRLRHIAVFARTCWGVCEMLWLM